MPKINRKYYMRAKKISDACINIVESTCDLPLLPISTSSVANTNNIVSYMPFVMINYLITMKTFLVIKIIMMHNIDSYINDDSTDDINSYINDNRIVNHNCLNNIECCENDNVSITLQLQEWAIRNRISHIALNELMAHIRSRYPELLLDALLLY